MLDLLFPRHGSSDDESSDSDTEDDCHDEHISCVIAIVAINAPLIIVTMVSTPSPLRRASTGGDGGGDPPSSTIKTIRTSREQ
jgi:hypothetical protein